MKIKGNGRSALILVAGLWVCFAGPSPAAAGNDATTASSTAGAPIALNKYTRHGSRHWRRYAHHRSSKVALKSTDDKDDKKAAATDVTATDADKSTPPPSSSEIPPTVANAKAELAASNSPTSDAAQAMSVRANNIVQNAPNNPADAQPAAESQVVAPDQLNDVDRALHEANAPATAAPLADGRGRAACGLRHGAGGGRQRCQQQRRHLGQNLADRKDLHRIWRAADDGLRCAHVHGMSGLRSRTRHRVRDTPRVPPEIRPT